MIFAEHLVPALQEDNTSAYVTQEAVHFAFQPIKIPQCRLIKSIKVFEASDWMKSEVVESCRLNHFKWVQVHPQQDFHDAFGIYQQTISDIHLRQLSLSIEMENQSVDAPTQPMIPPLVPKSLEPRHWSRARLTMERLNRIQYIQVASNYKDHIKIHVYLNKSASRLPTRQSYTATTSPMRQHKNHGCCSPKPDTTVNHTVEEFDAMQASISEMLEHYHPVYCELCSHLKVLLLTTRLRALAVFSGGHRASHTRAFLEHVLSILRRDRRSDVYACPAFKQLPIVLHDFLFVASTATLVE